MISTSIRLMKLADEGGGMGRSLLNSGDAVSQGIAPP
jgi:hypothetical protein